MITAGIDYSMTSPAICVHDGKEWCYKNCKFYYLVKKEKLVFKNEMFIGDLYPEYTIDTERFDNLAQWSKSIINDHNVEDCYIEGYAFGATGRVFNIAENGGILKHALWMNGTQFDVIAPTIIKKFATGKGNANKEKLYEAFLSETGIDIRKILDINNKSWNPISDIVDAYYIAKYGFMNRIENEQAKKDAQA